MNKGISRITSAQMRARAIAYEEAAHHLERGLNPEDEDSPQEEAVAKHCRTLARMWTRRADKGPLPVKRRLRVFKSFWVKTFRDYSDLPAGSRLLVTRKWRHLYEGTWASSAGTFTVRVPKAACSID